MALQSPMRRRHSVMLSLASPAVVFIVACFLAPLALLAGYSLFGYAGGQIDYSVTLSEYAQLLGDPFYLRIMARTLLVSLAVTIACGVLGYPVAYGIMRARPRWRPVLLLLVLTPLLIGGVVRSYGWILILDDRGFLNRVLIGLGFIDHPLTMLHNFGAVTATMAEVLIPFFILPLMGALSSIDPMLERASLSMGASGIQTFLSVTFPLSMTGVIAGSSIVFSLALNIFVVPQLIGGPSYLMLATLAYQQVGQVGNLPFGAAIAMLMLAVTFLIVAAINWMLRTRFRHLEMA